VIPHQELPHPKLKKGKRSRASPQVDSKEEQDSQAVENDNIHTTKKRVVKRKLK